MPILIDDAEIITSEPHGSCTLETIPAQQKEKTSQSTSVVPAKYPPKVKLELLTTLKC